MKGCDEELLTAFADGDATPDEAARVARHLESCAECARELRWLKASKASLAALPQPVMPPELHTALLREAARRAPPRAFWSRLLQPRVAAPVGLAFAAASVVLLLNRSEEVPLEDLLVAHEEYESTLPAAPREALFSEQGGSDDL